MPKLVVRRPATFCSFCGGMENERGVLVAGPAVHICEMCVEDARKVILDTKIKRAVTEKPTQG